MFKEIKLHIRQTGSSVKAPWQTQHKMKTRKKPQRHDTKNCLNASTNEKVLIKCVTISVAVVSGVLSTPDGVNPDKTPNKECHTVGRFGSSVVL